MAHHDYPDSNNRLWENDLQARKEAKLRRVLLFARHPSPYRNAVLSRLESARSAAITVYFFRTEDANHPEWQLDISSSYRFLTRLDFGRATSRLRTSLLLRLVSRRATDIVVIPGYSDRISQIAVLTCLARRIPYILSLDTTSDTISRHYLRHWAKARVIDHASGYWVSGKAARMYLEGRGVPTILIAEGAYSFDVQRLVDGVLQSKTREAEIRRAHGIPPGSFVFISIGRLTTERQTAMLIEAFLSVCMLHPDAKLVLIGDGPERSAVGQLLVSGGESILYIPSCSFDALPDFLGIANCYVHAGGEAYSTATEYAALAGLPIIANESVGYVRDLLDRGGSCTLSPSVPVRLAGAMSAHLNDPEFSAKLGRRNWLAASSRTADWAANEFLTLLNRLISVDG
jgi:glycosyltransferase involved in cell wall biosynthesis